MIGKPEWFTYSAFGWGIKARTWQGYLHGAVVMAVLFLILGLPIPEPVEKWGVGSWMGLMLLENASIMTRLAKIHDERENLQQMLIARYCSHAAFIAIMAILSFQVFNNWHSWQAGNFSFLDKSLLIVLGVMIVTKTLSTWYVRKKI
jgi:hypothetical protein